MNSFSNSLEKNELHFNYSGSLINILYNSNVTLNRNCIFKNNNDVIISFKDTVINKTIYVTTSGLKRNSVFKSKDFDKILAKKELNTFVSYFKILEDNTFRFDLYPDPYKKVLELDSIKKHGLIQAIDTRLLPIKNSRIAAKHISKYKLFDKKYIYDGSFDTKFLVKLNYRDMRFATSRGILLPPLEPYHYNYYRIMSGLLKVFKQNMQKKLGIVILSNYRLLRFFTKNFQNPKNNVNTFINILLYYYYAKFTFKAFFKKRDRLKIKWRQSNVYIFKYFLRRHKKIFKFINLFFKLILYKSLLTFKRFSYLNTLSLYKNQMFININNKFTNLNIKHKIVSVENTVNLLNHFIKALPLYLINKINFKLVDLENIHVYFLFKTLILKEYLIIKFFQFKLFKIKEINDYITPIFFSKSLIKINNYPITNITLMARRLYWFETIRNKEVHVGFKSNLSIINLIKYKKKFITKANRIKITYSSVENKIINNAFLKFYQFYISAKKTKRIFSPSYSLNKLMKIKFIQFTKRYIKRRKQILKFILKHLKKKRPKIYHGKKWHKWQKKLHKRRLKERSLYRPINLIQKKRRLIRKLYRKGLNSIFVRYEKPKIIIKKVKSYNKKGKIYYKKFPVRNKKIKIYKSINFFINKLKPKIKKIVTQEYVIPKFTRIRRDIKKIL